MTPDDEATFVNRRGHRPLVKEDLETLRIDDEPVDATPQVMKVAKKERRQREKRERREFKLKRWQKMTILVVVLLIVALPIGAGELVRLNYVRSTDSARGSVRSLTNDTVLVQQKKADLTSKDMSGVVSRLSAIRDGMCEGGLLDNTAKLYPRARSALETCQLTRSDIAALTLAMSDMTAELAYFEQLSSFLGGVGEQIEGNYAILTAQQENWKTLLEKVKALNPPTTLRSVHETLVTKVQAVADQWTALVNASSAQDATAFKNAETALTGNYEAIRAMADEMGDVVAATQTRVTNAYMKLQ